MKFKNDLISVVKLYQAEIKYISEFLDSVENSLSEKQTEKNTDGFSDEEFDELRQIRDSLGKIKKSKGSDGAPINASNRVPIYYYKY